MLFSKNLLFYRTLPRFALGMMDRYLRVEVEGMENIPARGPAILVPNHSGFMGFDALLLSHWIQKKRGRIPRIMLHRLFYFKGILEAHAKKFGFLKASFQNGISALNKNNLLIVFPEAEQGNFKPINRKYRLQDFRPGFVRMAERTRAPIIPVVIIGAEETHINLGQLKVLDQLLPLPLNLFPLPAKWKIKILPPVRFSAVGSTDEFVAGVRTRMQTELNREVSNRSYVYFDRIM